MRAAGSTWKWPVRELPRVTVAGRFRLDERGFSYEYKATTHALHLHFYDGTIRMGQTTRALRPGDVTVTPAGVPSRYDLPQAGHHWCVHFRPASAARAESFTLPLHFSLGQERDYVARRMADVAQLHAARGSDLSAAAASAALHELLLRLAMIARRRERESGDDTRGRSAVDAAARWLEGHIAEPLDVPALARQVGLTQNYLAKLFRRRHGVTIAQYLLARRIEQARHLLASTTVPIGRVAQRVGIPDRQYFNKQVRRMTGMSPSALRASRTSSAASRAGHGPGGDV